MSTSRSSFRCLMLGGAALSCLLFSWGCRIPGLRSALPGPEMPQAYTLNNGKVVWKPEATASHATVDNSPSQLGESRDSIQSDDGSIRPNQTDEENSESSRKPATSEGTGARLKDWFNPIRLVSAVRPTKELQLEEPKASTAENSTPSADHSSGFVAPASEIDAGQANLAMPPAEVPVPIFPPLPLGTQELAMGSSAQLPVGAFFSDPNLLGLVNEALSGNQELRILAEEINIANNEVYARSGEYRPFVTLGAGAGLEKSSRFTRSGAVEDQLDAAPGRGFPDPLPDFLTAANVSWELDVWKKLRNAQNAACMRFLASGEGRNYIVTRLVAEVAEKYYELLALDNRLITLQQTIEIQRQSLEVAKAKKAAGRGTELAVQRFQAEVAKNQSELLIIQQQIVEAENRINFLLGRYPQPVERSSTGYIDLNLTTLSAGLPAEILMNRADVRQAERMIQAAGLDVKVARARFYPSFGLNAGIGLQAFNMKYFLSTPDSLIYNVALDMVGPLINRRAIKADYCSANAAQLQSIYHYQQTVLTAHIEVVNHLTKVENFRQSIETKKQQIAALEASVDAANKLFQSARAEYVEVLLAQREMMEARMVLIELKREQLQAIVNAYQALGGGGF